MGLDMYLKKHFAYEPFSMSEGPIPLETSISIKRTDTQAVLFDITTPDITGLVIDNVYWRKANMIHQWFVDNVQEGIDDCRLYELEETSLEKLLAIIDRLLDFKATKSDVFANDLAKELLPNTEGFFFGSQEYDDWYWEELEDTQIKLKRLLEPIDRKSQEKFYCYTYLTYQSSW
ncbi:MAG: hypothetical protein KIG84_08995 [Bacteroidales bacterium]|nr:hypothetical protein [Bacteroidales bacterium]